MTLIDQKDGSSPLFYKLYIFSIYSMSRAKQNGSGDVLQKLTRLKNEMKAAMLEESSVPLQSLEKKNKTLKQLVQSSQESESIPRNVKLSKIDEIRSKIVGFSTRYMSPFHIEMEAVYVDHTATNKPYSDIEDMIDYAKLLAANPHTQFSHYGKFSTQMMHYAQDSMLESFNCEKNEFVALPTGSGSTGAIEKAMKILKLQQNQQHKPPVYLTPYEHHSNILPWVEFYDRVMELAHDDLGCLQIDKIEQQLLSDPSPYIILSCSAASNVTSTLTDVSGLNRIVKNVRRHKKVVFGLDCAAFCVHHDLDFGKFDQLDFAYLSPHKNLGGAEACGVLIARKSIVLNAKPTFPGGGTVAFVKGYSKEDIMYDFDVFNREIAGTPPFFGFYRAALCFELSKNHIGYDFIHEREYTNSKIFMKMIQEANARFKKNGLRHRIMVYGSLNLKKRANVMTFNIYHNGEMVQHSFVSLIFTDVFGIQLRSGCFCAGPYGIMLLKVSEEKVAKVEEEVSVGVLRHKPGYLRLDLAFYLEPYEIEYLARAVIGVAENAKSMELVYTVCNDGDIIRHKMFKETSDHSYSLDNFHRLKQFVLVDRALQEQRLLTRKDTLRIQMERGMKIIEKPLQS